MDADSLNPIVRRDSQQLLVYLLYSLSLKHLEAAQVGGWGRVGLGEACWVALCLERCRWLQRLPLGSAQTPGMGTACSLAPSSFPCLPRRVRARPRPSAATWQMWWRSCRWVEAVPAHFVGALQTGQPIVLRDWAKPRLAHISFRHLPWRLQARLGQQLWPREQPSLAHPMVPSAAAVALFVQTGA